ncbi:MAG: phage portal protein [Lentimicrobiaceae bacterium]|nr:phage portal protein [Lentimicrobiaceae bacterium]
MGLIRMFTNYLNSVVGRNQEFEELIKNKDISKVKELFTSRDNLVAEAMREYDPQQHDIMNREDKILINPKGKRKGTLERWKLPINYPQYINEISVVFIYGRPVKWTNLSEGTDNAFKEFQNLIKKTRFDSKIRQCKRLAGAETQSAMLFRVFRNKENKPDCQIRVLAKSKGDEIYARWDMYENLVSFAWGYYVKDSSTETSYHFDIFTPDVTYRCKRKLTGWEVIEELNPSGKIPIILFQQDKEWKGSERLIAREEYIGSKTADTNDYFADPILALSTDVLVQMPEKDDDGKTMIVKGLDDVSKAASYLTWDNASESKQKEIEWLQKHILTKTFTPNIDFESMKGLSNVSGKALKQMMLLADIKASKHKETHDELLDRTANLLVAIIGNVLNVALKGECNNLVVGHEFQEPFGEDIKETIENIVKAKDADMLSTEGAVELNPLIKDKQQELKRIEKESADAAQKQRDLFGVNQNQDDIFGGAE